MADTDQDLIYVRERRLPYETFDADNHLYENQDALTKFLPKEYEGAIKYVEVDGRTKLAIRDHISDYIPNPTFERVARARRLGQHRDEQGRGRQEHRATASSRKAHARHRRVLRPRAAPRADEGHGHRPHAAVADAGERARGARRRRPRRSRSRSSTRSTSGCTSTGPTCTPTPSTRRRSSASPPAPTAPSRSSSTSTSAAPRSSSSASRRCPRGRAASRSRCRSSTRSGREVRALDIVVGMHSGDPGYQRYMNEWEGFTGEMLPVQGAGLARVPGDDVRQERRARRAWRRSSATASPRGSRS